MKRAIEPEILDTLPEGHPDALRNRRDLRLLNTLMGNFRWFGRRLKPLLQDGDRILEIGSGDGALGQVLHCRLSHLNETNKTPFTLTGLDLCRRPIRWPKQWPWIRHDWRTFEAIEDYNIVLGNMILHQFEDHELEKLGKRLEHRARMLLFSEPARLTFHQYQLLCARVLGINYVTVHDGKVSIKAGFLKEELPNLLGLSPQKWHWCCTHGFFGQYRMVAIRS